MHLRETLNRTPGVTQTPSPGYPPHVTIDPLEEESPPVPPEAGPDEADAPATLPLRHDPAPVTWEPATEPTATLNAFEPPVSIARASVPVPPAAHEWVPQPTTMSFEPSAEASRAEEPEAEPPAERMRTWAAPESLAWADLAGVPWQGSDDWDPAARLAETPWAPFATHGAVASEEGAATATRGRRARLLVKELVETGMLALLVFLCVRATFQNFKVDGHSMDPTLDNGEFLIVNKLVYVEVNAEKLARFIPFIDAGGDEMRHIFHPPRRGNIIVLKHPARPETDLIKRVVGLPGETLEIKSGVVYINDSPLTESYTKEAWGGDYHKISIPEGEYFVMGDNRNNSSDSRTSAVGLVPEELIIGRATISYWPKKTFGWVPNQGGKLQAAFGAQGPAGPAPLVSHESGLFALELLAMVAAFRFGVRRLVRIPATILGITIRPSAPRHQSPTA